MEDIAIDMAIQDIRAKADDLAEADLSPEQFDALARATHALTEVLRSKMLRSHYYDESSRPIGKGW